MNVCTIETGKARGALVDLFGDYPSMAESNLRPHLEGATFSVVSPVSGEPLPPAGTFDAYVVMGSKHGVYEDLPWMEPLKRFIRQAAESRIPVVGICFGHQLMAEALGGRVEKADAGWIVGMAEYAVSTTGKTVRSMAFHQDQVVVPPPGSEAVLSNGDCAIAGLVYRDFPALSVQAHPEFDAAFVRELLRHTRSNPIDPAIVDRALVSLDGPIDQDRFFRTLALVLGGHSDTSTIVASLLGECP